MDSFSYYRNLLFENIKEKCPSAEIYKDIYLTAYRGDGAKADIMLHKSGVYLIILVDREGMLSVNDETEQWKVYSQDGTVKYITNYSKIAREYSQLLAKKCKAMSAYIVPTVVFSDRTRVIESYISQDITGESMNVFVEEMYIHEHEPRTIPAEIMPTFRKQLDILKLFSK